MNNFRSLIEHLTEIEEDVENSKFAKANYRIGDADKVDLIAIDDELKAGSVEKADDADSDADSDKADNDRFNEKNWPWMLRKQNE